MCNARLVLWSCWLEGNWLMPEEIFYTSLRALTRAVGRQGSKAIIISIVWLFLEAIFRRWSNQTPLFCMLRILKGLSPWTYMVFPWGGSLKHGKRLQMFAFTVALCIPLCSSLWGIWVLYAVCVCVCGFLIACILLLHIFRSHSWRCISKLSVRVGLKVDV